MGKIEKTYTYRYVNQVPLRDSDDALWVDWCELVVTDDKGKTLYQNAFATNHLITDDTSEALSPLVVPDGRSKTKITTPLKPKATTWNITSGIDIIS